MTTINGDTGIDRVQDGAVTFEDMPAGSVIQVANYTTGAMASGTAVIPSDNTIPQITEGTQFMSLAFTPKKANSKLKITLIAIVSPSISYQVQNALFRDSNVNAIATVVSSAPAGNFVQVSLITFVDANSTSLTTFYYRAGCVSAGTITFNGANAVNNYSLGGSLASSITIEEIAQ